MRSVCSRTLSRKASAKCFPCVSSFDIRQFVTHQNRLLVSLAVSLVFVVFPPWRATFLPLGGRTVPETTIGMPWPTPSFRLEGVSWSAQHDFHALVPIFTPPRPSAEIVNAGTDSERVIGVWSIALDLPRLILLMLLAFALSYIFFGNSRGVWDAVRGRSVK